MKLANDEFYRYPSEASCKGIQILALLPFTGTLLPHTK
jgi:hypothetical protein